MAIFSLTHSVSFSIPYPLTTFIIAISCLKKNVLIASVPPPMFKPQEK